LEPSIRWAMTRQVIEGNERDTYPTLARRRSENAGSPTGREPYME
jgi:hypothetical protein